MKLNLTVILGGLVLLLGLGCFGLYKLYRNENQKSERFYNSLDALAKKIEYNSDSTRISAKVMELKAKEVVDLFPEIKDLVVGMDLKMKNVLLIQRSSLEVNASFLSRLGEDIVGLDTTHFARFSDKYISFMMSWVGKDTVAPSKLDIPISLDAVLHKQRQKGFLWGIFKPKELKLDLKTDNPYVKLKYNQVIKITK